MISKEVENYINDHKDEFKNLLITLAQIPAPSNKEEKRAAFVKEWLENQGAKNVYIDDACNVIYSIGDDGVKPVNIIMAHMDIVFPDETPLPVTVEDGKIKAPGVGDDTANLCGLLFTAKYIAQNQIVPKDNALIIVANSGEEGLGNLRGSRKICETYKNRINEFISFDGYYKGGCTKAVGSKRYRVEIKTEGGHSYGCFGNRNAIAYLASLIDSLYCMKVPNGGKTTYNVGTIKGGTSVNTIAQQAEMLYEYRSDCVEDLEIMDKQFDSAIEYYRAKGVEVNVEILGERPCSRNVDETKLGEMQTAAAKILEEYTGIKPKFLPGSTDCNIPLSQGIPAICYGIVDGSGAHTREEFVYEDSLVPGYKIAFETVLRYL